MAGYSTLVGTKETDGSIKNWINWNKAPATTILTEAEAFIYSQLRVREMRKLTSGTITEGASTLAMPADFIAPISFRRTGNSAGIIEVLDEAHFESLLALDESNAFMEGTPTKCMIIEEPPIAYFDCEADDDITYRLVYFARPAALSASNETNWLTTRYPMLLRATCLGFANQHYKDSAAAGEWLSAASGLIASANSEDDQARQILRVENYWET